jgi:hypothetical protein
MLYIDAALQRLRTEGFLIKAEDLASLSPLVFDQVPTTNLKTCRENIAYNTQPYNFARMLLPLSGFSGTRVQVVLGF